MEGLLPKYRTIRYSLMVGIEDFPFFNHGSFHVYELFQLFVRTLDRRTFQPRTKSKEKYSKIY